MNVDKYFLRIGVQRGNVSTDLAGLALLQKQHLLHVPFENLDIHWNTPIVLDSNKFYEKIVRRGRGGFCYELNGLFHKLLTEIGFENWVISARVSTGAGGFSPEFAHLAILVRIGDKQFLTDVGFGEFTAEPLELTPEFEQADANGTYVIRQIEEGCFEVFKKIGDQWKSEYMFRDIDRKLVEFAEMCEFQQTSPKSHFTKGKLCSLMTLDGRKTLTDEKYIQTRNGQKSEIDIESEEDFKEVLAAEFGIKAPEKSIEN